MTVHANQKTGLTNGRVENWDWKSGSVLSVRFPIINWRSHSVAKSAWYFVKNGCQTNLIDVLRALFTGTVNKTKWLSQRVLCFGSLFRNYPPYCKSIYLAIFIKNCPFFDVLLGKWQSRLHGQDHTQSALRATVHRNSECQGLDPRVKGPLLPRPPTGNR